MAFIAAALGGIEILSIATQLGSLAAKAAAPVAIVAIDQGIKLFLLKKKSKKKGKKMIEKEENNMMDSLVIFNKINKSSLISMDKTVDTCLKQIQNIQLLFETNDFATSLDYLSDAWRALSRNNIKLFRESICESYRFARIAKNKIIKNPNHLLGVYSMIIFCGFCKFSDFGDDMYAGLQHIKDTLNEMSKGSDRQSLLRRELANIIKSSMFLTKDEQIYLKNIISFSIRVQVLVGCIVKLCKDNDTAKENTGEYELKNDNDSDNEQQKFGDMISILFPAATLNHFDNDDVLLNYLEWTPNIMEGKYFGGDKDKIFDKIDFWGKIYPVVFEGSETLKARNAFVTIYFKEIIQTLFSTKDFTKAIESCMMDESLIVKYKADTNKIKQIVLFLTLRAKMNQVLKDKSFKMPTKLIFMKGFNKEFNLCFSSSHFRINNIEFDDDANGVLGFSDVLAEHRGFPLESLTEITVRNTTLPLVLMNKFFWVLHNLCPNVKTLNMESVVVKYSLYYPEKFDDNLNLQFIPKSIETLRLNGIKFVESKDKRIDKYDEQTIKELMSKNSKRKIIHAMNNVNNKTDIDMIRQYLENNLAGSDMEDLHIFSSKYLDDSPSWQKQSSLRTMELSHIDLTEYNFNVLLNQFISLNCQNMTKIIINMCGITESFISLVAQFYQTNKKHKLSILDLSNNKKKSKNVFEGIENEIATERITLLIANELQYRNGINITYNDENEKLQMVSTMGQIAFVPMDTEEKIDSFHSKKKKTRRKTERVSTLFGVSNKDVMVVKKEDDEPHRYILDKSGEQKGKKKYKVRQLKLSNKGVFEYWDDKKLKGSIDLKSKGIISVCLNDIKGNSMQFGWQITTKQETYYFAANSENERHEWIRNIDVFNNEIDFVGGVSDIERFCDLNQNGRNGMQMNSLTKISIKNMTVSLKILHDLFLQLNGICIGLKVLYIESLLINHGDTLNLNLIPNSIEDFRFGDIKFVESGKKIDLNLSEQYALPNGWSERSDANNKIFYQNKFTKSTQWEHPLKTDSSLCTLDFSYIEMTQQNFDVLMNQFIGLRCPNMKNIILNNCGIMNSFLLVVSAFYKKFKDHKLCMFDLSNNIVFDAKNKHELKGIENEITTEKIISLLANDLTYRNDINIIYDNQMDEKVQIISNMGEFIFLPMNNSSGIELKLTNTGVVQYWNNTKLRGSINLKQDKSTTVSISDDANGGEFGWKIVIKGKEFVFAAKNESERNEWIQNIERALVESYKQSAQPEVIHASNIERALVASTSPCDGSNDIELSPTSAQPEVIQEQKQTEMAITLAEELEHSNDEAEKSSNEMAITIDEQLEHSDHRAAKLSNEVSCNGTRGNVIKVLLGIIIVIIVIVAILYATGQFE